MSAILAIGSVFCLILYGLGVPIRSLLLALVAGFSTYGIVVGVFLL